MSVDCYCGSTKSFDACCQPCLLGEAFPETAEQLMRSRYTAYELWDAAYLLKTWNSKTRPSLKKVEDDKIKWHRLKIRQTIDGTADSEKGEVAFEAIYKINGQAHKHIEHSLFEKEDGV